ncbi:5-guanidino-2-oxopentanoate decarboxylase [Enteractinococcus fodinae]|uniref:Acetolactate synthase-1/2/3 large subunit n=1 Tax=Enteractinococcus fodinae TaxID=684663 RepID=A0ABU2AY14_9MICC|nr:thiamine pyrophosphate-binding protein [Enteractinococcus fodinae]MDR7346046.1 acetolactate synthase-1/2/3 large subunit [Enteractinococcus fodinae]
METTKKPTTGWWVLETLNNYGVDTIFGIPGTHNLEFYRPLRHLGIRAVTSRHEQGAGYGADGWSLQTGLPGVVITTSGPGLLNALSAAATAFAESRPMIILAPGPATGQEFADVGSLHETKDQLSAAQAVVAWGRRVASAEEAVQAVHDAFKLFATGRPRPVYIEVPLDVLEAETNISAELLQPIPTPTLAPVDHETAAEAARLLDEAKNPVILAGGGARAAADCILELAERLEAPVVTTTNGKGILDEHHRLALGANLRLAAVRNIAKTADVLLVVGSKLGEADLWVDALEAEGKVIRIDRLESQINKNQHAHLGLVGEASEAVQQILAQLPNRDRTPAVDVQAALEAMVAESRELDAKNTALGTALADALPKDVIMSTDSSMIAYWGLLNMLKTQKPNSTPYMATYATLGYGLPAAIGAKIGAPERPVVAVLGDGALMFSVQEFMTAVEQDLDLTVIVVNNGGYAEIKNNEADVGIAPISVDLAQPDWPALVQAFGGAGISVTELSELPAAVDTAVASGGLQLIHVPFELVDKV